MKAVKTRKSAKKMIQTIRRELARIEGVETVPRSRVADMLGVSAGSIDNWEKDDKIPSEGNLAKLEDLLAKVQKTGAAKKAKKPADARGRASGDESDDVLKIVQNSDGPVRVSDIATRLRIGADRIGATMKRLISKNLITLAVSDGEPVVTLTPLAATVKDEASSAGATLADVPTEIVVTETAVGGQNGTSTNGVAHHHHHDAELDDTDELLAPERVVDISKHYAIGLPERPDMPKLRPTAESVLRQQLRLLGIEPLDKPSFMPIDGKRAVAVFGAVLSLDTMRKIIKEHNQHNRDRKLMRSVGYSDDMRSGNWEITGETTVFDEHCDLVDGQHRIMGALAVGKPLATIVVIGVRHEVFRVLGGALARSVRDRMVVAGRSFADVRTRTLVLLNRWEQSKEDPKRDLLDDPSAGIRFHGRVAFEIEDVHARQLDLDHAIEFVSGLNWRIQGDLPKHVAVFMLLFLMRKSKDAARHFIRFLVLGGAPLGSPILACKDALAKLAKEKRTGAEAKQRTGEQIKLMALAWNAYCVGRTNTAGHLTNRHNLKATALLDRLASPNAKVEEEARSETTPEVVTGLIERARNIAKRDLERKQRQAADLEDTFLDNVKKHMEVS
jgi:DNA-binding transcriptional regulator YiaG